MRRSNPDIPRVDTPREELHDIYESALVEARPLDAPDAEWQELVSLVTKRGQGGVVITGWNPGQLRPTLADNQEANIRLLEALKRTNYEIWEADGFSPDRSFREPGFIAWGMDSHLGCSLARDFGQFAIFFYESDGSREVIAVKGH
jgi:Protein of unknown function (DUF3293)